MSADNVQTIECPSCGAPVDPSVQKPNCRYCGAFIEGLRPAQPEVMTTSVQIIDLRATSRPRQPNKPQARTSCLGVMVLLIALIGLGVGFWINAQPARQAAVTRSILEVSKEVLDPKPLSIVDDLWLLPNPNEAPPDLLTIGFYSSGNDQSYELINISSVTNTVHWRSTAISKEWSQVVIIPGDPLIFLADEGYLLALRRSDGTVAWRVSLATELPVGCEECLQLVDDHLVALTRDGTVQSFVAATGQADWSHRLNSTTRRMFVIAGHPAVLDQIKNEQDQEHYALLVFEPREGKLVQQIMPICVDPTGFSDEDLSTNSSILTEPDDPHVYFMFGFFRGCTQRWNVLTGERLWESTQEDGWTSWNNPPLLIEDQIFFGEDNEVRVINGADGSLRTLAQEKDYSFQPLTAYEGTLVVHARPSWDNERNELWGIQVSSGERLWQSRLKAKSILDSWDLHVSNRGLTIVQTTFNEPSLLIETLNPQTGASQSLETIALERSASRVTINWGDQYAWARINNQIHTLDLATNKIVAMWP